MWILAPLALILLSVARKLGPRTIVALWIIAVSTWSLTALALAGLAASHLQRLGYQTYQASPDADIVSAIAGYEVTDPSERQLVEDLRDGTLQAWLIIKSGPDYSYSHRFTWALADDGAQREAMADRAIADAILQLGRALEPWEVEQITDRFVDPNTESAVEFVLITPLFLPCAFAARYLRAGYRGRRSHPPSANHLPSLNSRDDR